MNRLVVDGSPFWELDHDLPVLWPWLFDASALTESHRLHSTLFDAAQRFHERLVVARRVAPFAALLEPWHELTPDRFPRLLGYPPDTIMSLDLTTVESRRPYQHQSRSAHWEAFFEECAAGRAAGALSAWEEAALTSLRLHGRVQRDALALAAQAESMGLARTGEGRATAAVWLLFGRPVARPSKALDYEWRTAMASYPPAAFIPRKRPWWKNVLP